MTVTLGARIRNRSLRTFLRVALRPGPQEEMTRLGTDYGGWWLPTDAIRAGSVAYCAGAGEDISFDLALHDAGMRVTTFDPTPRAIAYVGAHAPPSGRFRFEPVGWWSHATTARFYAPKDPAHVSHSILNLQRTDDYFDAPVQSVQECMACCGDQQVDLIKMDIEGAEYEVIDSLLRDGPLPSTLCIEFDQPQPIRRTIAAVRRLRSAGYRLRKIERWNYTFTR
jgi:FkbM family methyltransferase